MVVGHSEPSFDLGEHHVGGGAGDMGAGLGLGPGAGVAAVALEPAQAFVPGRMEFDLVAAVAVAVEQLQLRRAEVGQAAMLDPLGTADFGAARQQPVVGPAGALLRTASCSGRLLA
jgi:hypothetical protein